MNQGAVLCSIVALGAALVACGTDDTGEREDLGRVQSAWTQTAAPWHLDRIDQRNLPLDTEYNYSCDGEVDVYIVSTGINPVPTMSLVTNDYWPPGCGWDDVVGTGTAMAGLVGDGVWGVAKGARLHNVKVSGCSAGGGTPAGAISGALTWLKYDAVRPSVVVFDRPLVAFSSSELAAIRDLSADGLTVILPIGSDNWYSPEYSIIQVAATDDMDAPVFGWTYSNGPLWAPGDSVPTWDRFGSSWSATGNEFAAAVVAGVAAQYLEINPSATPFAVKYGLLGDASPISSAPYSQPASLVHGACL